MLLCQPVTDIAPPRAAFLGDDVLLLAMFGSRAVTGIEGHPELIPPYGTVEVDGSAGPHRLAATRLPPSTPWDLQDSDPLDLTDELDMPSCRRLLGFLLGFCRTAFGLSVNPTFTSLCIRLARRCAHDCGGAEPVGRATPAWCLLRGAEPPAGSTLYHLSPDRIRLSEAPALSQETTLLLTEPMRAGDILLALCSKPVFWSIADVPHLPDVMQRGNTGDGPASKLRAACLQALAPRGGTAAALFREWQITTPARPRRHDSLSAPLGAALEVALPDGEGGLFLRGWLRDPLQWIVGAELRSSAGTIPIEAAQLHRVQRPDISRRFVQAAFADGEPRLGFIAHVPDPSGGLCVQPTLALRLRSGSSVEVRAPLRHLPAAQARDAVMSCVGLDQVTPSMLDGCLIPALAALHRQTLSNRAQPNVVQIGKPIPNPTVSALIPLYRTLGFLRFQIAALAADPDCARVELIYALDSPEQRAEAEHLLQGLHAMYGIPVTLLVMPGNFGYAAATNVAAAAARGSLLLLLNSDVVPARPGWLAPLRAALAVSGVGAVGPKLLFDDGSIQHAGLFFERDAEGTWFNDHYHKGMPRYWPAAQRRRRVPGVTGAALLVRRALFEKIGGICEDYIIGDYEDSDFCLRLQDADTGAGITYVPEAELFHFERRSIRLHAGYTGTLACLYNRRLHHGRWNPLMADLMASRAFRQAA